MKLFLALILSTAAQAQTLVGLPEFGVTLSGTPNNPVIENHASQAIIGHVLRVFYKENALVPGLDGIPLNMINFKAREIWRNHSQGIQPNQTEAPLNRPVPPKIEVNSIFLKTPTKVVLDSVVFANGQQVGPDVINNFANLVPLIAAYKELASMAHNASNNPNLESSLWMIVDQAIAKKTQAWPLAMDLKKAHNSADAGGSFNIADRVLSIPAVWRAK